MARNLESLRDMAPPPAGAYVSMITRNRAMATIQRERISNQSTTGEPVVRPDREHDVRNPGMPLELDWVRDVRVNRSAVERRAATIPTRRSVKKDWQAAWLLRAIRCIDLTTLAGDDTPGRVRRLCAKARRPLEQSIVDALGIGDLDIHCGAVCVYHEMVATAVDALAGSDIPVAAVSAGFPAGLSP